MTSRLALDHRSRLYLRSANIETAVTFLNEFRVAPTNPAQPGNAVEAKGFTLIFNFRIDLQKVYRAVLKTSFNLFCHLFGDEATFHDAFNPLRKIVLDGVSNGTSVMNVCQLTDDQPANFPKSGSISQHRMMLTVSRGALFHLRLYDHFSYTGIFNSEVAVRIGR